MLKELLLIYTCSTGIGCGDTSAAYYQTSPDAQQVATNVQIKTEQVVGETAYKYILPTVITVISKKDLVFAITSKVYLEYDYSKYTLGYKYEF